MLKKVFITGAGGFVGRNLTEYFRAKSGEFEIIAFSHEELDLLDPAAVAEAIANAGPDVILHCASVGGSRGTGYNDATGEVIQKNLAMFFNIERCLGGKTRMISFGSGAEYDMRCYKPKMAEDYFDSSVPVDPYGYSKYLISKYIAHCPNIVCLRIFALYGKYEDYRFKFISNTVIKNILKLPIVINQNVNFDYLWIGDFLRLVESFVRAAPPERHYNITPTKQVDLVSLAQMVNSASDTKSEIRILNERMNTEYSGANGRLLRFAGPFAYTTHEHAITELREYYLKNMQKLDQDAVRADAFFKHCNTKAT